MAQSLGWRTAIVTEIEQSSSTFSLLQKEWVVANCMVALFFLAVSGVVSKVLAARKNASLFERLPTRDKLQTVLNLTIFICNSLIAIPFTLGACDVTFSSSPLDAVVRSRYRIVYGLNILSVSFLVRFSDVFILNNKCRQCYCTA
jgi:hypothetical protein